MIIDAHVNITPNGKWFDTSHKASIERLFTEMKLSQIEKAVILSMPGASDNNYIGSLVQKYPNKLKGLGFLDFRKKNIFQQIDEIIELGLSGIKINPRFQNVDITSDQYLNIWEYLNEKGLILYNCGFLTTHSDKQLISNLLPFAYEKLVRKYTNIKFVLCHAGCHKVMDTFFLCKSIPNFYTDVSFSLNYFKGTSFWVDYKFLIDKCPSKILFGSDFPEYSLLNAKNVFLELVSGLDSEKVKLVMGGNALNLFW